MVMSKQPTPAAYLDSLPEERRKVIRAVRAVIRKNLPKGYMETMNWGMLAYEIPLSRYPDTYNNQPACYVGLAAQKNNYAIYLTTAYADPSLMQQLRDWYTAEGKRFDMGKSCLRFKRLEDIPLDIVGSIVASTPVEAMIEVMEKAHPKTKASGTSGKPLKTARKANA